MWSRLGSNQRPSACEADALPLSHGTAPKGERGGRLHDRRLPRTRRLRANRACDGADSQRAEGSCVRPLASTIVVLRTGRRSRPLRADVAQLVAHHLAKVRVAGSNPVIRSRVQLASIQRWSGRVVRQRPAKPCTRVRFPSPPPACLIPGAISSAGERFPDTEEVTGSIPVSRTRVVAGERVFSRRERKFVNSP